MCATSQRITNILHYFFYYRILKTRLSIFPRNQKKKDRNFCLVFFLLPIPILVVASYRSWDFDRVYEFFSLLHRGCKKRKICSICFTTTRIWLVGTISRRALCVIRTVLIVWIHITRRKAFKRLCVQRFTWLSFWACHIISKGKMEVDEPTKARVLTAKWMPYLWTTKKLIYYLLFFFFVYFWNTLCNFLLLLLLCNIVIFIIS